MYQSSRGYINYVQQREIAYKLRDYFQEINYRIKNIGSLWYDWGNELIVVSQNLNIVMVQYFEVHRLRNCFVIAKSNR